MDSSEKEKNEIDVEIQKNILLDLMKGGRGPYTRSQTPILKGGNENETEDLF